jgi:transposase
MYMSWESGDEESQRMAIAQLYECGRGSRAQPAEAFGVHVNSVQNYIANFARDGFGGIATQRRGPRGGWKLTPRRRSKILAVAFQDGVGSVESVQDRLRERWHEEISLPSIRQVLEENGLLDAESLDGKDQCEQGELFEFQADRQMDLGLSEYTGAWFAEDETTGEKQSPAPDGVTDTVAFPRGRCLYSSAQLIYFDRLEQGDYNAYVGGLLFVPFLEQYEFLPTSDGWTLSAVPRDLSDQERLARRAPDSHEGRLQLSGGR